MSKRKFEDNKSDPKVESESNVLETIKDNSELVESDTTLDEEPSRKKLFCCLPPKAFGLKSKQDEWKLQDFLSSSWKAVLSSEFEKDYFPLLEMTLKSKSEKQQICPPIKLIFEGLNLCPYENVRVVILGQDPYYDGNATGMAFSVPSGYKINSSLKNIFREIATDVSQCVNRIDGDLSGWARQGVLLLNTILTTENGKPLAHQYMNWQKFTDSILLKINEKKEKVVFMLWGKLAKSKMDLLDKKRHTILTSGHPSPLSLGFEGCKHFSACNRALNKPIDWDL